MITRTNYSIFLVLTVLALGLLGSMVATPASADTPDTLLGSHLDGDAAGSDSKGQGQANFNLSGSELDFVLALSRLEDEAFAAHIHISAVPGGDGPPVVTLCGGGPAPSSGETCKAPGAVKGSVSLTSAQITDLLNAVDQNRAYVNVHTVAFPGGEIRGQVTRRR